jgi:quercetin dioxygenase-like cupin family protein
MVGDAVTEIRAVAFEVPPGGGERVSMAAMGHEFLLKASTEQTGGAFSLSESTSVGGASVNWHVHYSEDEAFYVLHGEYHFTIGGEDLVARAGELIFVPRGTPHRFSVGPEGGRCLTIFAPGGYENAFRKIAVATERGTLTSAFWDQRSSEHETRFLDGAGGDGFASPRGFAARAETAERIDWPGVRLTLLAGADRTGGSLTLIHDDCDAFTIPWHVHQDDEAFYVLKGRYRIRCGDQTLEGGPGTFFFLPRNVPHEQTVLTNGARKLALIVPAGIEGFFRGMAEAINDGTMTTERKQEIACEHRLRFLDRATEEA